MQNRAKWTATLVGIAIVALFVVSFLPTSSFVGGAGATVPAAMAGSMGGGVAQATVTPTVTPHGGGPHPGTLEIWEATGGGPSEVDPSVCYYTVCDEPISNVYQTLIAYNGTDDGPTPSQFVPQVATCVPGSGECQAQFGGNDLVWNNNTTGLPQYYTFEIDAAAHFYDPTTGVGWGVYPSDVLFTMARTMGFADLPYEEATNGWINTQDLVAPGNFSWDAGIHAPLNNTPQSILNAFLVNNSYYCPSSPTVVTNGCITFNLGASAVAWPYFLELVGDALGGSIQPCGLTTFINGGSAVPGFTGTALPNGDGPCRLPGNSNTTQDPGFMDYVANTPATGWDTWEEQALSIPAVQPALQWIDVGSGPYYVENPINPDVGYTLHANPDYQAPVGCAGQPGCEPLPGAYAANVDVVWEASGDGQGLNEMAAGQADSAGFFSTDVSIVQGYSDYKLVTGIPALTVFFDPITLNFSLTKYVQQDTNPINIPSDFFANVALRNFLVNAYPYTSVDQTYNTVNGIQFGEDYGGAIPHGMGNYYPTNITWPGGNPVASPNTPGNVAWWWAQANNASSPYYDPELAACTPSTPCVWDMFGVTGATVLDGEYTLWNAEINSLSGGALNPGINDISGQQSITNLGSPPGQNPMPVYSFGWVADYPDPSDFTAPMYYPDNSYTAPDAVSEALQAAPNNASTCPNNYGAWSNLTFYANIGELPNDCQGAAYDTMTAWEKVAAHEVDPNLRVLQYNLIEHIAALLGLYIYNPQSVAAFDYGVWIQPTTVNTNPTIGGGAVQPWYQWGYASDYFDVQFNEAGLTAGTQWSVTVAGVSLNATAPAAVDFGPMVNGTYPYTVGSINGFLSNPASGNLVVDGAAVNTLVTYTAVTNTQVVTFSEAGLKAGVTWGVVVTSSIGGASPRGNTPTLTANLPAGTYNYTASAVAGYTAPANGQFTVVSSPLTVDINYSGVHYTGYIVTFTVSGLPTGGSWEFTVNGSTHTVTTSSFPVTLGNGSYSWGIVSLPTGYTASPSAGFFAVSGSALGVTIALAQSTPAVQPSSSPAWTYLSTLAWVLIGVLALLVVIFLALALMAGRRPPSSPPETWSSSSTSSTDATKDNKGGM